MGGAFGVAFFLEPVAVAADVDDGGAVEQPVEGGGSHDGISGEDLAPVGEGLVAGEHDGLLFLVAPLPLIFLTPKGVNFK